ncbi:MAG: hypothetical protein SNJ55_13430, partial [Chloroherpetonaceae bacterium]
MTREMILLKAILLMSVMIGATTLWAQKSHSGLAHGGNAGNYIELGRAMVSKEKPYLGIERYLIERREAEGESVWKEIASVSAPTRYDEFLLRLAEASLFAPEPVKLAESDFIQLWEQIQNSNSRVDSLFYVGFLPIRLALGLAYLDTSAKIGTMYLYRVSTIKTGGAIERTVYSKPVSFPEPLSLDPPKCISKQVHTNEISIRWQTRKKANVTFLAFRRVGLSPFIPIDPIRVATTKGDTLILAIRDTLVQPNLDYAYFIAPQDFYGNFAPISDTVSVLTTNFQNLLLPQNLQAKNLKDLADSVSESTFGIKISWTLENIDGVKSVEIYRSQSWEEGYERIASVSPKETSYIDATAEEMKPHFYRLQLVGLYEEKSRLTSRVFAVAENPAPPIAPTLEALATPNGIEFRLMCEDEVAGYRLYRADENDSLLLVSALIPKANQGYTVYVDSSIKGDARIQTYAARSESKSFVMSAFSEKLSVKPNLQTRPKSPMNLSATIHSENGVSQSVKLTWEEMSPFVKGIQGYQVLRRALKSNSPSPLPFEPCHKGLLPSEQNHFSDTTLTSESAIEYAVILIDGVGEQSDAAIVSVQLRSKPPLAPPSNLSATPTASGVVIRWNEVQQENLQDYVVYRYEREHAPLQLGSVSKNALELVDSTAQKETLYFYFVKSRDANGEE